MRPLDKHFFAVPLLVYQPEAHWLGEEREKITWLFSAANLWHQAGKYQIWCDPKGVRLVGFSHPLQKIDNQEVVFFGFWEGVFDFELHRQAFGELEKWARSFNVQKIVGPIDFNTFHNYRLRQNCQFADDCFPGEPFGAPWYEPYLAKMGFSLASRYFSQFGEYNEENFAQLTTMAQSYSDTFAWGSLQIIPLSKQYWMDQLDNLFDLMSEIFGNNFGYQPVDRTTFKHNYGEAYYDGLCPHSSRIAVNEQNGQLIGFLLAYPDYSPLILEKPPQARRPQMLPYATAFPQLHQPRLIVKTGGVRKEYRNLGIAQRLGLEVAKGGFSSHYKSFVVANMKSDNVSSRKAKNIYAYLRYYALYAKEI